MSSLGQVIKKIEQRPELYLHAPTIFFLKTFLDGYVEGENETGHHTLGKKGGDVLIEFQRFVEEYYHEKRTYSWARIINNNSDSPAQAMETFFRLFNEYEKSLVSS